MAVDQTCGFELGKFLIMPNKKKPDIVPIMNIKVKSENKWVTIRNSMTPKRARTMDR